jgi:hypothetical protein
MPTYFRPARVDITEGGGGLVLIAAGVAAAAAVVAFIAAHIVLLAVCAAVFVAVMGGVDAVGCEPGQAASAPVPEGHRDGHPRQARAGPLSAAGNAPPAGPSVAGGQRGEDPGQPAGHRARPRHPAGVTVTGQAPHRHQLQPAKARKDPVLRGRQA